MKHFLLLLLLIPLFSFAQYEGTYSLGGNFVGWTVSILSHNRFTYKSRDDCSYGRIGQGWYQISRNTLHLHFENDTTGKLIDTGDFKVKVIAPKDSTFCNVRIFAAEKSDSQALIGATIMEIRNGIKSGRGMLTDLEGKAVLTLNRWFGSSTIEISYPGLKSIIIPISLSNDYEVNAQLAWHTSAEIPAGTSYSIKIHNKTRKGFDLVVPKHMRYRKKIA